MKKVPKFLLFLLGLLLFVSLASLIYHLRVDKIDQTWLFYVIMQDISRFLPLITPLSIVWSLVFRGTGQTTNADKLGFLFTFFFYVIFTAAASFAMNELLIPYLHESASHKALLAQTQEKIPPSLKGVVFDKFDYSEVKNLKYFLHKNNVAFMMGRVAVSFDKIYKAGPYFYMEGVRFLGFDKNNKLNYIINAQYGKYSAGKIMLLSSKFIEYQNNSISKDLKMADSKSVPVVYDMAAVYHLSNPVKEISMLEVFLNSDYVFESQYNFLQVGNLIFNKISYYIILTILLIFSSSAGWAFRNQRPVSIRDIFQAVSFYVVSFIVVAFSLDMLIRLANMIYSMAV
ncbi:MAG: hypothetical protein A2Y33_14825 [Spirochaetes bacterium GWF1_51_8]|nr:MAG: hypothetical protein A2Y33_14825 [Spirochaetes bacterium GWF1_51_8]